MKKFIKSKIILLALTLAMIIGNGSVYAQQNSVLNGSVNHALIDIQYFTVQDGEVIISDTPINSTISTQQSNNLMAGTITYYYRGLDSKRRPMYNVTATNTSSNLSIKSSNLKTRAQGVKDYSSHNVNHYGKVAVNSYTYVYTSKNPPSNAYCEVKLYVTDSENFQTYIGYTKLKNAIS